MTQTIKIQFFEVTSSLKFPNWLQLAIQQLSYHHQNTIHRRQTLAIITGQEVNSKQQSRGKNGGIGQTAVISELLLYTHIKIYDGKPTINFSNQSSLIALTRCILRVVFGVEWSLPISNLCPRVPNRVNYLIWINRYLIIDKQYVQQNTADKVQFQQTSVQITITSLDIGTGASLIYPLLGTTIFGWKFIATQKDQASYQHASKLIIQNNYQSFIHLRKTTPPHLLKDTILFNQRVNFVLCNPPFFDTQDENTQPLGVMTSGQHNTLGGEYEFFFSLYVQSFHYQNIEWFSMMIGLGRDFEQIKAFLERQSRQFDVLSQVRFGKINQSHNSRFIIAWKTNTTIINNPYNVIIERSNQSK